MPGFNLNRVVLAGNLTAAPEHRQIGGGVDVCNLRLAVNDRTKDQQTGEWTDRPNYFDVTIWRGLGAWAANNLRKGDQVVVEGKLRWRQWEAQDGGKRTAVDVTADTLIPPRGERRQQRQSDILADTSDFEAPQAPSSSRPPEEDSDDIPFVREPDRFEWEPWHR